MLVLIDRVGGEIEAKGVALGRHPLGKRPPRVARQADGHHVFGLAAAAEQTALPAGLLVMRTRGMGEDGLSAGMHRGAVRIEAVERTGRSEALELAAVEDPGIDPRGEILKTAEGLFHPFSDQFFHRLLADALERAERVAHTAVLDVERRLAGIDVGRQQGLPHAPQVIDEQTELVGLVEVVAHRRGIEFGRVMRLQPGGMIGDQGIGRRVALVEAVTGELVDQVEQFVGLARLDVLPPAAFDKTRALGVHLALDLLAHGAAQEVGFAEAVTCQYLGGLHHLFLVDEDAVGFLQHLLQQCVRILISCRPFLRSPNNGILSIGPGR